MKNSITLAGSTGALIAALTAFQSYQDHEVHGVAEEFVQPTPQPIAQTVQEIPPMPTGHVGPEMVPVPETIQTIAPPTPNVPAGREGVDSNGIPWDARIHGAGKKAKNADGSWRGKRGVDKATVAAVTAELQAQSAPPIPNTDAAPVTVQTPPIPNTDATPVTPQPVIPPIPNTSEPAAVQTNAAPVGLDFGSFMANISERLADGKLDTPKLTEVAVMLGLNAITDVQPDQAKIDQAVNILHGQGRWFA